MRVLPPICRRASVLEIRISGTDESGVLIEANYLSAVSFEILTAATNFGAASRNLGKLTIRLLLLIRKALRIHFNFWFDLLAV